MESDPRVPLFAKIGDRFKIDDDSWIGTAIASGRTIYLVMTAPKNILKDAATQVVRATLGGKPDQSKVVHLQDISSDIRDHRDWPAKLSGNWEVLVIPRHDVQVIVHPRYTNLLCFDFGSKRIQVEYPLFRGARVRGYLEKIGWSLNWGGKWPWK